MTTTQRTSQQIHCHSAPLTISHSAMANGKVQPGVAMGLLWVATWETGHAWPEVHPVSPWRRLGKACCAQPRKLAPLRLVLSWRQANQRPLPSGSRIGVTWHRWKRSRLNFPEAPHSPPSPLQMSKSPIRPVLVRASLPCWRSRDGYRMLVDRMLVSFPIRQIRSLRCA